MKERQPILLAEFENRSTDSTLGPTLTEAFRVDLTQSQSVKLVDGAGGERRAHAHAAAARHSVLTPALARELAQREGIPAIVTGEIAPVGKSYVISANVVSTTNASVLTALRETAANDGELIPAVDRLSRALRERVGESLVTIRADAPLAHVTTGSLMRCGNILRACDLEMRGERKRRFRSAAGDRDRHRLRDGVAEAGGRRSATTVAPTSQAAAAATHAYQHRDRLSEAGEAGGDRPLLRSGRTRSVEGDSGVSRNARRSIPTTTSRRIISRSPSPTTGSTRHRRVSLSRASIAGSLRIARFTRSAPS